MWYFVYTWTSTFSNTSESVISDGLNQKQLSNFIPVLVVTYFDGLNQKQSIKLYSGSSSYRYFEFYPSLEKAV